MEEVLKAYLVLGCCGFISKDNFTICQATLNPIVDLEDLDEHTYKNLIHFFEYSCSLFDKPIYEVNKISNVLNILHRDYRIISEPMLMNVQRFIKTHRDCGMYLILTLKEDYKNE